MPSKSTMAANASRAQLKIWCFIHRFSQYGCKAEHRKSTRDSPLQFSTSKGESLCNLAGAATQLWPCQNTLGGGCSWLTASYQLTISIKLGLIESNTIRPGRMTIRLHLTMPEDCFPRNWSINDQCNGSLRLLLQLDIFPVRSDSKEKI